MQILCTRTVGAVMKRTLSLVALGLSLAVRCFSQSKPIILISGNGNISINSSGEAVAGVSGGVAVGGAAKQTTVNKHDQTIEMAGDFLNFCPAVELTLLLSDQPDYYVFLNREGQPTVFGELGQSQIMVLNRRKSVVFVAGKKATVKNAVRSACNAIIADWQANGRLAVDTPTGSAAPSLPSPLAEPPQQQAAPIASVPSPQAKLDTVAIVIHTTAAAEKYCKPQTITSVMADTNAYVISKGVVLGTVATSKTSLTLIIDRPTMKWIEITVQGRDGSGNLLWSEKVSEGAWAAQGHTGTQGMLNTLAKVHQVIDAHLRQ